MKDKIILYLSEKKLMERIDQQNKNLVFKGNGAELFQLLFVNILLLLVTLGFYYPWAKVRKLRYLYNQTELDNKAFTFHGTGKEIFWGFIKSLLLLAVVYGIFFAGVLTRNPFIALLAPLFLIFVFLFIMPLAIHGSLKYRLSRSSWSGIHFGYRGERGILMKKFIGGILLTFITLYIYLAWFIVDLRKYIISNIRFGNVQFRFDGTGGALFLLNLKGIFLSLITFGIYGFWWMRNTVRFYINNLVIVQNEKEHRIHFTGSAGDVAKLVIVNFLLMIITLGLAFPWVLIRNLQFIYTNSQIDGTFETQNILQTEDEYKDALGEDMTDIFDINII